MQCTPQSFLGSQSCYRGKWSRVCVSRRERLKSQQPGSPQQALVLLKNLIGFYCYCNQVKVLFLGKVSLFGVNSGLIPHYRTISMF